MCFSKFLRARITCLLNPSPLRLRQWKPVSLPEGVLMALTHCLEQQNIKDGRQETYWEILWRRSRRQKSHTQGSLCCRPCAKHAARRTSLICPDIMRQGCGFYQIEATEAQRGEFSSSARLGGQGPGGLISLRLCGCRVLGDRLPLPSRDSFQQTARVLIP